jgi:[ribosomal protein S18]-alanine N-acetyltransferase
MMSDDVIIRKMITSDVDSIMFLQNESNLSAWTKSGYIDELARNDSVLFVAVNEQKIIGFVVMRLITATGIIEIKSKGEGEILNIAVTKEMRGKRIGAKLVRKVFETAKEKGIGEIWLEVRESNINAQNFYKAMGFSASGKRIKFYNNPAEDAVLMRAEIN